MSMTIMLDAIPVVLSGLWFTLEISILAFVLGQILALPIGLARSSGIHMLNVPAYIYTWLVRGSPVIVQLFIVYYGLGQVEAVRESVFWVILREPIYCAILTVGLNSAAYVGELLNGAIRNIPKGQAEAAQVLGLSRYQTLVNITLPQVYRAMLPPLGNELTLVMKASSLASAVTVMEITGAARALVTNTYAPFEVFAVAGALYLIIGVSFGLIFRWLEVLFSVPGTTTARSNSSTEKPTETQIS